MIRHPGTVVRVEGDLAWVECARAGRCALCPGGGACEAALFSGDRPLHRLRARTGARDVAPGAQVVVGVRDGALLRAAVMAYGLPLGTLLAGAFLGSVTGPWGGGVGAALGLTAGLVFAARAGRTRGAGTAPVILEQHEP
jgi:sigma-E factor negative regulatory protein RseC